MTSQPTWLKSLVDAVSVCIEAQSPMGPLGYRWAEEDDFWEVIVYPTTVELVGGAVDGEVVVAGFSVDLTEITSSFDRVDALSWCAHDLAPLDFGGPHISLEGIYQGHEVWVRVLSDPPPDEEPGMKFDTSGGKVV